MVIKVELFKRLNISLDKSELISIVGGGGKTTTMFRLASELVKYNKKVLIGTTTAIFNPDKSTYDRLIILDQEHSFKDIPEGSITVLAKNIIGTKLKGPEGEVVDEIYKSKIFDYIILEADGAKMKPIKAPASHEPVIPKLTTKIIGVIGTDCFSTNIDEEYVHRPEILAKITDSNIGDTVNEEIVCKLVTANEGLFKSIPENSERYLILNKVDSKERRESALRVKELLRKRDFKIEDIIIGNVRSEKFDYRDSNGFGIFKENE